MRKNRGNHLHSLRNIRWGVHSPRDLRLAELLDL
jgi:hypothetical protein